MEQQLNHLLADLVVEYHKLQSFHWYVEGSDFFQVHAKLEEEYDIVREAVDQVAEVVLQLGGKPVAGLPEILAEASIEGRKSEFVSSEKVFSVVRADYQVLLDEVLSIRKSADEKGQALVSATMDGYVAWLSKDLWMFAQQSR